MTETLPAAKTVRFQRWIGQADSTLEVDLRLVPSWTDRWQVWHDGENIGEVSRYTGTLDRPTHRGLLRVPGKRRILWSATPPGHSSMAQRKTRADALRWLFMVRDA